MAKQPRTRGVRRSALAAVAAAAILLVGPGFPGGAALAQHANSGVIAGSVTADRGEVRALRVKAHDTVHRIAYTVYTVDGGYRIFNLSDASAYITGQLLAVDGGHSVSNA